jgi:hypothetical protein
LIMPRLIFSQSEIEEYFKERTKHHFYERTKEIAHKMKVHADGEYPTELIEERRPNEPLEVKEYRKKIWVPTTKPTFSKVFSSLQKIRRSSDWFIKFENLSEFTKISDEENIEAYTETKYPYFTSITNWAFSLLLRKYLIDPNAVVSVMPLEFNVPENEFVRPFPFVFDSNDVIDYVQDDFVVLNNPLGSQFLVNGAENPGRSIFIITTQQFLRYDQIDNKLNFTLVIQETHGLGILPAFTLGGVLIDQKDNHFLYESRIAGMLPELDEAVREYSDLQAAKVLHIYPERWEFSNTECQQCKGLGRRRNPAFTEGCAATVEAELQCDTCHGRGYVAAGPYSKIIVRPVNSALETGGQVPNPPAGYVEKDVEIVKVMGESVSNHKYEALAAINFQFLEDTPLNESGKAKEVDKDELNNTVHSIAEDIVACIDKTYKITAYWRYKGLYSLQDIDEMLPLIPVPEKYDILSPQHKADELSKAKQDKANPVIINALEIDYASARFGIDPSVRDRLSLILELDPLPNITEDEKMSRLSNKGISLETYVISSNIHEFVQRAIDDNEGFVDKKLKEQKAVMLKYATEEINKNTAAAKASMKLMQDTMGGLGPNGEPLEDEETQAA